ncbi:MAG TPA: F0F1 ATP synthase subunit B [Opitutaceae bacterium]|nr:F0F1 ATP synthase subunit B [Opitutaceae bacterium]
MPSVVAASELVGRFQDILSQFGIEGGYLLWQVLSFSILAFVLYRFLLKPVLATMGERQKQIDAGLKYTEEMKLKLAQAQQDSAAIIKQAQLEGARFIEETRKTAKEYLDLQQREAAARAGEMLARAQQTLELEHRKMLDQARLEISRLVVATTQRVLAKELSETERARYNEAAAREITVV